MSDMRILAKRSLLAFWLREPKARAPLEAWYANVESADWKEPADVKAMYGSADFVGDNRIIFNIGGNKYRLIVRVAYPFGRVLIKFVGTHADYDEIDPETV